MSISRDEFVRAVPRFRNIVLKYQPGEFGDIPKIDMSTLEGDDVPESQPSQIYEKPSGPMAFNDIPLRKYNSDILLLKIDDFRFRCSECDCFIGKMYS